MAYGKGQNWEDTVRQWCILAILSKANKAAPTRSSGHNSEDYISRDLQVVTALKHPPAASDALPDKPARPEMPMT